MGQAAVASAWESHSRAIFGGPDVTPRNITSLRQSVLHVNELNPTGNQKLYSP